jgi:MoaA/NifB/PqqE/SkfB family radical SAM enzyme
VNPLVSQKIKPYRIGVESSSLCQLSCPSCPTASGLAHAVTGKGWLQATEFETLLEENPWVRQVELSNYGEMFLNPQIPEILRIACERNVRLTADNGVNLNRASPEALEALVRYRFHSMKCSIDGCTPGTYALYRSGGDLRKVLENIRTINRLKREYRSKYPLLTWQFIAFKHNTHEIPAARQFATELGMDFVLKLSWDPGLAPDEGNEQLTGELGVSSRDEYRKRFGGSYVQGICRQLWEQPQINWDGKLLGCSRNFWGDFGGNAFTEGLLPSINNEKITHARNMLRGKAPPREDIPCSTCDLYLNRAATGNWIASSWIPVSFIRSHLRHGPTRKVIKSLLAKGSGLSRWLDRRV